MLHQIVSSYNVWYACKVIFTEMIVERTQLSDEAFLAGMSNNLTPLTSITWPPPTSLFPIRAYSMFRSFSGTFNASSSFSLVCGTNG